MGNFEIFEDFKGHQLNLDPVKYHSGPLNTCNTLKARLGIFHGKSFENGGFKKYLEHGVERKVGTFR